MITIVGLRYIVQISNDIGLKQDVEEWSSKLRKLEQTAKAESNKDMADILISEQSTYKAPAKLNVYDVDATLLQEAERKEKEIARPGLQSLSLMGSKANLFAAASAEPDTSKSMVRKVRAT